MKYIDFLKKLDKKLINYFEEQKEFIHCKKGCSLCCEKGDYPISQAELEYLMQGFINLENDIKLKIQENFKNIEEGGICPFLINSQCSVYEYRPIICRVHGLSYLIKNNTVKVPYCVHNGKNYSSVYSDGKITVQPIKKNLDTYELIKDFDFGEIRNLYQWWKK